jgi:hypothetical protein
MFTSGIISGEPTERGSFTVTLSVTNGEGSDSQEYTFDILATVPVITSGTLTAGVVGEAYTTTLAASGSTPITWEYEDGTTYPPGLSLSTAGVLSGTPTDDATFSFNVVATNEAGDHTKQLTVVITRAPLVNPNPSKTILATEGQTLFTISPLTYSAGTNTLFVWRNGKLLYVTLEYLESSTSTVTLLHPCIAGEELRFLVLSVALAIDIPPIAEFAEAASLPRAPAPTLTLP